MPTGGRAAMPSLAMGTMGGPAGGAVRHYRMAGLGFGLPLSRLYARYFGERGGCGLLLRNREELGACLAWAAVGPELPNLETHPAGCLTATVPCRGLLQLLRIGGLNLRRSRAMHPPPY